MSENSPKLLDLINKSVNDGRKYGLSSSSSCCDENNKLELRLGLPGDNNNNRNWSAKHALDSRQIEDSLLSLGHHGSGGVIRCGKEHSHQPWTSSSTAAIPTTTTSNSAFQYNQTRPKEALPVMVKDASQACCTRIVELQSAEKKTFSPSSALTAVPNISQKRYNLFSFSFYFFEIYFILIRRGYSFIIVDDVCECGPSNITLLQSWILFPYSF